MRFFACEMRSKIIDWDSTKELLEGAGPTVHAGSLYDCQHAKQVKLCSQQLSEAIHF